MRYTAPNMRMKVRDELTWKQLWHNLTPSSRTCVEKLDKTTRNLNQYSGNSVMRSINANSTATFGRKSYT